MGRELEPFLEFYKPSLDHLYPLTLASYSYCSKIIVRKLYVNIWHIITDEFRMFLDKLWLKYVKKWY